MRTWQETIEWFKEDRLAQDCTETALDLLFAVGDL